jgi:chromosome segregation ATPase
MDSKAMEFLEKMYLEFSQRFEQIDKRFEQIDKRFEQIDKRFEQIDKRFEQIDEHFNKLEGEVQDNREEIKKLEEKLTSQHDMTREELKKEISYVYTEARDIDKKVDSISKDVKFIKHKEFQNEQELFELKDQLKVIK